MGSPKIKDFWGIFVATGLRNEVSGSAVELHGKQRGSQKIPPPAPKQREPYKKYGSFNMISNIAYKMLAAPCKESFNIVVL